MATILIRVYNHIYIYVSVLSMCAPAYTYTHTHTHTHTRAHNKILINLYGNTINNILPGKKLFIEYIYKHFLIHKICPYMFIYPFFFCKIIV